MSDESRAPGAPHETNSPTRAKQTAFLEAIAKCGNITEASRVADMNRASHYDWLESDPAYGKAFEAAKEEYRDLVRETVRNRAIVGTPHEIYFQGTFVGFKHEFSDRLLELEAKAHCPEYKDKHEITGPGGGPVKFEVITGVPQPGE